MEKSSPKTLKEETYDIPDSYTFTLPVADKKEQFFDMCLAM